METPPARWLDLRRFTTARIALGRTGNGLPTEAHLAFQLAHAAARDAVHAELDVEALRRKLGVSGIQSLAVHSAAPDRRAYLLRPDLGRRLDDSDRARLAEAAVPGALGIAVCDGLSATGVQRHAVGLITHLLPLIRTLRIAPVVIARQGRVALGDDIGAALQVEAVVVIIGERPGLSSPDSLGLYLTWQPRPGRTDAERNCISNVRPAGFDLPDAARKLAWLIGQMRALRLSGVGLKDEQPALPQIDMARLLPTPDGA